MQADVVDWQRIVKAPALELVAQRFNDLYRHPRFFRSGTRYANQNGITDIILQEMTRLIILMTVRQTTTLPHVNEWGLPIFFLSFYRDASCRAELRGK